MPPDGAWHMLAGVATVLIAYGALFGCAELLRRRGIPGETTRTAVHVGSGLLALGLPYLFRSPWPVILMAIAFAGAMIASEAAGLLGSIHDVRRQTIGALLFPIGIAAAFALSGGQAPAYPIAVLALGLGDPAASFAGRRFARRYASIWATRRSIEGSAGAFIVSTAITAIVLLGAGGHGAPPLLATSLAVGVAVALAEAASPYGLDNLAIPVVAASMIAAARVPWGTAAVLLSLAVLATVMLASAAWRGAILNQPLRGRGRVT